RADEHFSYARKAAGRNAQAISKVCIAALGRLDGGVLQEVRIAMGSVAPVPIRLQNVERRLRGQQLTPALIREAGKLASAEVRPIDDVRSAAAYRRAVAGNLVMEFLEQLLQGGKQS